VTEPTSPFSEISDFIRVAAEQMKEFGLTSIDVKRDGTRIRLSTNAPASVPVHVMAQPHIVQTHAEYKPAESQADEGDFITAPMIGTFYSSPAPGEPVFVEPGDEIEIGQIIGIIEAMKIMNEIAADRAGIVEDILVRNAQAVEYGQPLLRLLPAGGA
jgi:acetyl-CoA carboxylase biotin carboxyl carrier protein